MKDKNIIGLDVEKSKLVTKSLNQLLADYQIYYQNLRGFHWLILGNSFFQLHELFEKLYDEASETIDSIAERVLMLGETPLHTFESYLKNAKLKQVENVRTSKESLNIVNENMQVLLSQVRKVADLASKNNDEGTLAIMSELISKYEKHLWMFSAQSAK